MKTIRGWRQARPVLERWRKNLTPLTIILRSPRIIGAVPIDFETGERIEEGGQPRTRFRAELVYHTAADVTLHLPRGALMIVDTYELLSITDGRTRIEPNR